MRSFGMFFQFFSNYFLKYRDFVNSDYASERYRQDHLSEAIPTSPAPCKGMVKLRHSLLVVAPDWNNDQAKKLGSLGIMGEKEIKVPPLRFNLNIIAVWYRGVQVGS